MWILRFVCLRYEFMYLVLVHLVVKYSIWIVNYSEFRSTISGFSAINSYVVILEMVWTVTEMSDTATITSGLASPLFNYCSSGTAWGTAHRWRARKNLNQEAMASMVPCRGLCQLLRDVREWIAWFKLGMHAFFSWRALQGSFAALHSRFCHVIWLTPRSNHCWSGARAF